MRCHISLLDGRSVGLPGSNWDSMSRMSRLCIRLSQPSVWNTHRDGIHTWSAFSIRGRAFLFDLLLSCPWKEWAMSDPTSRGGLGLHIMFTVLQFLQSSSSNIIHHDCSFATFNAPTKQHHLYSKPLRKQCSKKYLTLSAGRPWSMLQHSATHTVFSSTVLGALEASQIVKPVIVI